MENLLARANEWAPGTTTEMAQLVAHLDAAHNLARWLLRNREGAEDAVQEAYLRACSHIKSFRGGDSRAWLLAIVRNCCYDRIRQGAARENTALDEDIHGAGVDTPTPETSLLRKQEVEGVRHALQQLPTDFREVLILREFEEMSYSQIAAVVQIPMGTVMSRLSRARQQLQQLVLASQSRS